MTRIQLKGWMRKHGYALIVFTAALVFLFYPNIGIYDWEKEINYYDFIRQSFLEYREFPLFTWNRGFLQKYPAINQSAFFAGNPETMLFSPLIPLLFFLPSAGFLKLMVVINLVVGWLGIQKLSKLLNWQVDQNRIFSALFFLSPIVFQHVAIGYLPWLNLYLLPWLLYFLLLDENPKRVIGVGIVFALILLQGGLHVSVWFGYAVLFFTVLKVSITRSLSPLIALLLSGITASLLALPRLISSFQAFSSFEQRFFNGYSPKVFLNWALIPPLFTPDTMDGIEAFIEETLMGVPYWDGSLFWGFLLLCVLLLPFVIVSSKRKKRIPCKPFKKSDLLALTLTAGILLFLSFDGFYEQFITFIADLIHLPALKGMEKYPFRFAIPAYYIFSFVVTTIWEDFRIFFKEAFKWIVNLITRVGKYYARLTHFLQKHKLVFAIFSIVIFSILFVITVFLKGILGYINSQITLAFNGQGARFLVRLMENTAVVPLEAYLSKAETRFHWIQRFFLYATLLLGYLWITIFLEPLSNQRKRKLISHIEPAFKWLPEILIVLPLLLAFAMWWRVALATPIGHTPNLPDQIPLITMDGKTIDQDHIDLSATPTSLFINIDNSLFGKKLLFPDIAFNDSIFLESENEGLSFVNSDGKLAMTFDQSGSYKISVKQKTLIYSAIVAFMSWCVAGWLILRKPVR